MEAFCEGGKADEHGFLTFPNATYAAPPAPFCIILREWKKNSPNAVFSYRTHEFLENLNRAGRRNNFFEPNFTPQDLAEIPRIYRKLIEEPVALQRSLEHAAGNSTEPFF